MKPTKWPFLLRDGCAWPNKDDSIPDDLIRCAWQELADLLGSKSVRSLLDHAVVGPAELRYLEVYAISKGWGRGASTVLKEQRDSGLSFAVTILLARGVSTITEASNLLAKHYDHKVQPDTIRKAYEWSRKLERESVTARDDVTNLSGREPIALSDWPLPDIHFEEKADDVSE